MMIELDWLERRTDREEAGERSFIKSLEGPDLNSLSAVEMAFKEWLDKRVRGRHVIVSDLRIFVDGKRFQMEKAEESALYRRIGDAAGQ